MKRRKGPRLPGSKWQGSQKGGKLPTPNVALLTPGELVALALFALVVLSVLWLILGPL